MMQSQPSVQDVVPSNTICELLFHVSVCSSVHFVYKLTACLQKGARHIPAYVVRQTVVGMLPIGLKLSRAHLLPTMPVIHTMPCWLAHCSESSSVVVPTSSSTCVDNQPTEDDVCQLVALHNKAIHVACEHAACTSSVSSDAVEHLKSLSKTTGGTSKFQPEEFHTPRTFLETGRLCSIPNTRSNNEGTDEFHTQLLPDHTMKHQPDKADDIMHHKHNVANESMVIRAVKQTSSYHKQRSKANKSLDSITQQTASHKTRPYLTTQILLIFTLSAPPAFFTSAAIEPLSTNTSCTPAERSSSARAELRVVAATVAP